MRYIVLSAFLLTSISSGVEAAEVARSSYDTGVPLIAEGQTRCVVIYPSSDPAWSGLAQKTADAIAGLGTAEVPAVPDVEAVAERCGHIAESLRNKNLILLGDLNTNRAIFSLYANYYVYCDARYPGEDGYILRTIVRPFGHGVNYLLIGGSTTRGVEAGVETFLERIRELSPGPNVRLPYLLDVKLGTKQDRLFAPALEGRQEATGAVSAADKGVYRHNRQEFARNAHLYFLTGEEGFAERAREYGLFLAGYEPDEPGIRVSDYGLENLSVAWRRVRPSPVFAAEEREKIDARMYETVVEQEKAWWRQHDASKGIGMRHHTTGMLAWWTLIRVLLEIGEFDQATRQQLTQWRSEAEIYLDGLLRHYWDDADDYQSADSIQNTASYALQSGQLWWFETGLARRAAQRLLTVTDNLGWYVGIQGYGEALPGWERFQLNGGLLLGSCGFVYQDGSFKWIMERFPALQRSWGSLQPWGLHQYDTGERMKPEPPTWLRGMQAVRFTPYRLAMINSGDFLTTDIMDGFRLTGLKARHVPAQLAFDKLVVRGGYEPADSYLLLQGMSAITLSTIDMNSIIRYGDQGKIWLVHNTARRSLFFKNAVYISRGLNTNPVPAACELVAHADFGDVALAASRLPDYRGTSWTRNLFVKQGRFTAVVDHVRAEEEGQYTVCCTWRTPGFASLTDSGWRARQGDAEFFILPGEMRGLTCARSVGPDGATRPTVLRQNRSFRARPGDNLFYENLLYTSGPLIRQRCEVRRLSPGAVVIREHNAGRPEELSLAAACDSGIVLHDLKTDAKLVLLSEREAFLAGGKTLELAGRTFNSEGGRVAFDGQVAEAVQQILKIAWRKAALPQDESEESRPSESGAAPQPTWTNRGPCTGGRLIDGIRFAGESNIAGSDLLATDWILPVLRAEPRLTRSWAVTLNPKASPSQAVLDREDPDEEPALSPLRGSEFILELAEPTRVSEIVLFGDTFGETSKPVPDAQLDLELTFTSDRFRKDRRVKTVTLDRQPSYHNLYKGHTYLFECYAARGLDESAKAIRVRVQDATLSEMILTDVQVRGAAESAQERLVKVRPMDLDGDQRDELLTWTTEGELAVVRPDGSDAWRKRFSEGIINVDAWDLDDDGVKEVFISRTDRHVVVLNADGSPRWQKDFREMFRQTDEKYYSDGSAIYGMAVWKPSGSTEKQVLLTSYWFTARLDPLGNVLECFRRGGHFTQVRAFPRGLPEAGGLAIRSDIPWVGPVPLQWWDAATGEPASESSVPNGPCVFFEIGDFDADGSVDALVATEQGVGLFAPSEPKTRWEHMTDAPAVGVGVIQRDGRPAQVAYGRRDGRLLIIESDGSVLRSVVLDEPLTCLTALRTSAGQAVILAGTDGDLRCLRWKDLGEMWRRPGRYQRLELFSVMGKSHVLAVTAGGNLEAFDM